MVNTDLEFRWFNSFWYMNSPYISCLFHLGNQILSRIVYIPCISLFLLFLLIIMIVYFNIQIIYIYIRYNSTLVHERNRIRIINICVKCSNVDLKLGCSVFLKAPRRFQSSLGYTKVRVHVQSSLGYTREGLVSCGCPLCMILFHLKFGHVFKAATAKLEEFYC